MSRRSVPRSPSTGCVTRLDPEVLALRVHQIAAVAGVLADGQDAPLSHAIHLIEECLLDVERRVEGVAPAVWRSGVGEKGVRLGYHAHRRLFNACVASPRASRACAHRARRWRRTLTIAPIDPRTVERAR